jgi:hypothetical protein
MKNNKKELDKFKAIFLAKADEMLDKYPNKTFTSWEIVAKVLSESSGYDVHYLTLKADLDVIKLIAEGLSASSISNRLSVSSLYVYAVAKTWEMYILDSTLDFNPLLIYKDGMSAEELMVYINEILPLPITLKGAKDIVINIEKYYDFVKFLEEYDNEKG